MPSPENSHAEECMTPWESRKGGEKRAVEGSIVTEWENGGVRWMLNWGRGGGGERHWPVTTSCRVIAGLLGDFVKRLLYTKMWMRFESEGLLVISCKQCFMKLHIKIYVYQRWLVFEFVFYDSMNNFQNPQFSDVRLVNRRLCQDGKNNSCKIEEQKIRLKSQIRCWVWWATFQHAACNTFLATLHLLEFYLTCVCVFIDE